MEATGEDEFVSCSKLNFEERSDFMVLLDQIKIQHVESELEMTVSKLFLILDKYQEQPQILDSNLEEIVSMLLAMLRAEVVKGSDFVATGQFIAASKVLYYVTKVRGPKAIVKFLSHEAAELEPLVDTLSKIDRSEFKLWEVRYVLLLWLSLVIRIPLDLFRIDSNQDSETESTVRRVQNMAKAYLSSSGKEREASAELLARLYTRKDMSTEFDSFISWALGIQTDVTNMFQIIGVLYTLCGIFNYASRAVMIKIAPQCLEYLDNLRNNEQLSRNTLIRKFIMKLSQRIGLANLKPKVASWRYKRGNRILKRVDPKNASSAVSPISEVKASAIDDEEEDDIPELIEDVLENLISGVKDKDTVVRWSAAKGIGRISQRLPKEFAEDVIESSINLFAENTVHSSGPEKSIDLASVDENTWHGACLALAELARRGLLLPDRLPQAVSWVIKALHFDKKKATYSVGANVRDAACYVCWSFARAYDPEVMSPYVSQLAPHLVIVTVFDREVNVRRAASAAFQENVGRQGLFPHGIDIITIADYFNVGNRAHSFTQTALEVAQFDEYRFDLIEHLVSEKTNHWDSGIRILTSESLLKLTRLESAFILNLCTSSILDACLSTDLSSRHGAILALARIIDSLDYSDAFGALTEKMIQIPAVIYQCKNDYLSSFGSEIFVNAVCSLLTSIFKSNFPISSETAALYLELIESCLVNQDINVQQEASNALSAYTCRFPISQEKLIQYVEKLDLIKDPIVRKGFTLGIKKSAQFIVNNLKVNESIMFPIFESTRVKNDAQVRNDAECRQFACDCITSLFTVDTNKNLLDYYDQMMNVLLEALDDYSVDARGDVGSWVRESAMKGLREIAIHVHNDDSYLKRFDQKIWNSIVGKCIRQSMERIDKVRTVAGDVLEGLLRIDNLNVPHIKKLRHIILCDPPLNWSKSGEIFEHLVSILAYKEYRSYGLLGITSSIGSVTESLTAPASAALVEFIEKLDSYSIGIDDIVSAFVELMNDFKKNDRVIIPLFDTLEQLLNLQLYDSASPELSLTLLQNVRSELFKCKDMKKLTAGIKVIGGMMLLPCDDVWKKCLEYMLLYLRHPYPRVRKFTAETFYMSLVSVPDSHPNQSEIETILVETNWDLAAEELNPIRAKLDGLFSKND